MSNPKSKLIKKALIICLLTLVAEVAIGQGSGIQLIKSTVIGGEGGWDYLSVEPNSRRLFVSHGSKVEILDVDSHQKLGEIGNLNGVHGVIAVPSKGRGITTNGRSNTATIFDLKSLAVIAEVPTGKNPDALLYDSFSDRVFIFDHTGGTSTVIDLQSAKVAGTITLGGSAAEAGVSDEKGNIYVNLEDVNEIVVIDAKSLAVKNRWKIGPGVEPTGIAMDRERHRLFSVCHNEMLIVLDSNDGKIVAQVPIGKRVDGVVYDPKTKQIISSNGEGTLTVVQQNSANEYKVAETVKTEVGARTIAWDPKTHHVFVTTAKYGPTPEPTAENPRPRPSIVPGTFMLLEFGRK